MKGKEPQISSCWEKAACVEDIALNVAVISYLMLL